MPARINLIGQEFGWLTVEASAGSDPNNEGALWLCKCRCGNERKVTTKKLRQRVRSCGCQDHVGQVYHGSPKGWTYGGGERRKEHAIEQPIRPARTAVARLVNLFSVPARQE